MLRVEKEEKGNSVSVRFVGALEENTDFDALIGPPPAELIVNCKEVTRINSVAVKAWIKYFQTCVSNHTKLKFVECSVAIVEQLNMILNFVPRDAVESIQVPYVCTSCHHELFAVLKCSMIKQMKFTLPPAKCSKCGSKAEFDDVPESYLAFLMD